MNTSHIKTSHYSGPNALTCDLCTCSFETQTSRQSYRSKYHPGAEPQKRNKYGIPDVSEEDAAKCGAIMELLPMEDGSKTTTYRCMWGREGGQACDRRNTGLDNSRAHACTHLGLKPHTCPASGCNYSSSFYGSTVKHYKSQHQGEEKPEEQDEKSDDEPPEKRTKSSAPLRKLNTRKTY
ncbi:zinc finger protein 525-like [Folsomia candida]|uniref:zinc finger protein 525-like n=1 Tax=Folsomia candida TaxID=158441 RepID=UPI0016052AA0|nr:zinc finger protein 525-like [Folsomia candida]